MYSYALFSYFTSTVNNFMRAPAPSSERLENSSLRLLLRKATEFLRCQERDNSATNTGEVLQKRCVTLSSQEKAKAKNKQPLQQDNTCHESNFSHVFYKIRNLVSCIESNLGDLSQPLNGELCHEEKFKEIYEALEKTAQCLCIYIKANQPRVFLAKSQITKVSEAKEDIIKLLKQFQQEIEDATSCLDKDMAIMAREQAKKAFQTFDDNFKSPFEEIYSIAAVANDPEVMKPFLAFFYNFIDLLSSIKNIFSVNNGCQKDEIDGDEGDVYLDALNHLPHEDESDVYFDALDHLPHEDESDVYFDALDHLPHEEVISLHDLDLPHEEDIKNSDALCSPIQQSMDFLQFVYSLLLKKGFSTEEIQTLFTKIVDCVFDNKDKELEETMDDFWKQYTKKTGGWFILLSQGSLAFEIGPKLLKQKENAFVLLDSITDPARNPKAFIYYDFFTKYALYLKDYYNIFPLEQKQDKILSQEERKRVLKAKMAGFSEILNKDLHASLKDFIKDFSEEEKTLVEQLESLYVRGLKLVQKKGENLKVLNLEKMWDL